MSKCFAHYLISSLHIPIINGQHHCYHYSYIITVPLVWICNETIDPRINKQSSAAMEVS
jgi:hypothetical protein